MSALACSQPSQHVAGRNFQVPSQNTTSAEFTASNKVSLASSSGLALVHRASSWALVQALGLWLHSFASVHVYTHLWSVCPTVVILGREDPGGTSFCNRQKQPGGALKLWSLEHLEINMSYMNGGWADLWAGKVAQWVKVFAIKIGNLSSPWNPHHRGREPTPENCPNLLRLLEVVF